MYTRFMRNQTTLTNSNLEFNQLMTGIFDKLDDTETDFLGQLFETKRLRYSVFYFVTGMLAVIVPILIWMIVPIISTWILEA